MKIERPIADTAKINRLLYDKRLSLLRIANESGNANLYTVFVNVKNNSGFITGGQANRALAIISSALKVPVKSLLK